MQETILLVGHDAELGGAQIALLHILTWLRTRDDIRALVLLKAGGDLLETYASLAPTYLARRPASTGGRLGRLALYLRGGRIPAALALARIDLVHVNTVAALDLVDDVSRRWRAPVLCQVRELEMAIRAHCGLERFARVDRLLAGYVCGTNAVATYLRDRRGIAAARIHRVPPGLPSPSPDGVPATRTEIGLPSDAFVVGGAGAMHWWKAPDFFVQVARAARRLAPERPIHFVWVGGGANEIARLRHDAERSGVAAHVHFLGWQREPHRYFAMFDVFLLTSREDTFPLVCVEAAMLGIPIVCFADAGGAPELVEDDAGFVVPYLDVAAAAERLVALAVSPGLRQTLGHRAAEKAHGRHCLERMTDGLAGVWARHLERPVPVDL